MGINGHYFFWPSADKILGVPAAVAAANVISAGGTPASSVLVTMMNYGRGRGVGRALGPGVTRGAGVGVAVGVAVGLGVGVGVAPTGTIAYA
jgi:hypothetical protein